MKKKNLFSLVALATLTLGSCTNDEVVNDYSQDNAIQFGTYVGRNAESRVAETTTTTLQESKEGFGVFATYNQGETTGITPNFMNNQQVTYDEAEWIYSPIKYWPNNADAEVSFWAYAPYNKENDGTENTAPSFKIHDGIDYVAVAEPVVEGKQAVNEKVKFVFDHMMSRIGFKVEAIIDQLEHEEGDDGELDETGDDATKEIAAGTRIVVTNVKLVGALTQEGTMTWTLPTTENKMEKGDWVLETTTTSDSNTYELKKPNLAANRAWTAGTDENGETIKITGQNVTTEKAVLNNEESYFMVVPQENVKLKLTVQYYVITKDDKLDTGYSRVLNTVESDEFEFDFERGHAYNFVLHLGLTSVKFEAEINSDWEWTETDHIVNVPINTENSTTPEEGGQTNTGGIA